MPSYNLVELKYMYSILSVFNNYMYQYHMINIMYMVLLIKLINQRRIQDRRAGRAPPRFEKIKVFFGKSLTV